MELLIVSPVITLVLFVVMMWLVICLLVWLLKMEQKRHRESLIHSQKLLDSQLQVMERLMDKSLALLSSKEPMAFQAVQAMNSASDSSQEAKDNSDHAEYQQWIDENNDITTEEKELLRAVSL